MHVHVNMLPSCLPCFSSDSDSAGTEDEQAMDFADVDSQIKSEFSSDECVGSQECLEV